MKSGYLLRDVIDKIDAIHFTASDELHTLGALYENLLREMREGNDSEHHEAGKSQYAMTEGSNRRSPLSQES